jgi:hypothetical protein
MVYPLSGVVPAKVRDFALGEQEDDKISAINSKDF